MELTSFITTIIISLIGGSIGGAIVNGIIQRKATVFNKNFDIKIRRYQNIVAYCELYLNTKQSVDALAIDCAWDITELNIEDNKLRAFYNLKINRNQFLLLTNSKILMKAYDIFLENPNQSTYETFLYEMKKDLWNR